MKCRRGDCQLCFPRIPVLELAADYPEYAGKTGTRLSSDRLHSRLKMQS